MTKECGCALATKNLIVKVGIISHEIKEADIKGKTSLAPALVGMLHGYAVSIINKDIPEIKQFCEIDIKDEEKSLKNVRDNILKINESSTRDFMHNSITAALEGLHEKLKECKEKKK